MYIIYKSVKLSCCGYICFGALTHFFRPNNKNVYIIYIYIYICGSSEDFTCNYIKQEVLHYTEIINLLHARHTFAI